MSQANAITDQGTMSSTNTTPKFYHIENAHGHFMWAVKDGKSTLIGYKISNGQVAINNVTFFSGNVFDSKGAYRRKHYQEMSFLEAAFIIRAAAKTIDNIIK